MQESISISHFRNVPAADLSGFKDVLADALSEQGSAPVITSATAMPSQLGGGAVRIVWTGSYSFQSPDGYYTFSESNITVEVVAEQLDHNALTRLLALRSHAIVKAYRNALRGIFNMSVNLKNGTYAPQGMTGVEYLSETLDRAVQAFPNTN